MGFLGSPSDHNTVVPGKRLQQFPKILSRPKLSQFHTKKSRRPAQAAAFPEK
jgi:hypothetical protein